MELNNLSNLLPTAKIIDAFTFYNELDMLDFRLAELDSVVDYFVLVEATKTHSGNDKELWFENNKSRYSKYLHKIIHIVVDDFPETTDSWVREKFQRISIIRAFKQIKMNPLDIITITDCDEIPDPNTLLYLKNNFFNGVIALEQDFYYYNTECRFKYKWYHPKVCTYIKLLHVGSPEQIRFCSCPHIKNGGWHFSYFGSTEIIANKIKNFAHQEFNTDEFTSAENIEDAIKNNRDLFKREGLELEIIPIVKNKYLPKNVSLLNFTKSPMNIVQIGACQANDDLTEIIAHKQPVKLVLVEPLSIHNEKILQCYNWVENTFLENIAITENEKLDKIKFYYHKNDGPLYEVASLTKSHITKHGYDESGIVEVDVPCMTINQLFDKHLLTNIDILFIDAEGMDDLIIKSINFSKYTIKELYFENLHLSNNGIYAYLKNLGYDITYNVGKGGWSSYAKLTTIK